MNQLKRFLNNEIQSVDSSIIETLQQYDTIQIDAKMYQAVDIIKRIQQQGCPHCISLNRKVISPEKTRFWYQKVNLMHQFGLKLHKIF